MRVATAALGLALLLGACDGPAGPAVPTTMTVPDSVRVSEAETVPVPVYVLDAGGDTVPDVPIVLAVADTTVVGTDGSRTIWFRRPARTIVGVLSAAFAAAVPVTTAVRYVAAASGRYARWCGITTHNAAYCFPSGSLNGVAADSMVAVPIAVEGTVREVFLGGQACLLTTDDHAFCWSGSARTPMPVEGGRGYRTLGVGDAHVCGIATDGVTYCWGRDWDGRLGDGDTVANWYEPTPRPVVGGHTFRSVAAGEAHTCALDAEDRAWCWGSNEFGQLGIGQGGVIRSSTPLSVNTVVGFRVLAASGAHTCGLTADGTAYCWGRASFGVLGSEGAPPCPAWPGFTCELSPRAVATTNRFAMLYTGGGGSADGATTCALLADGAAWCWGWNRYGETGIGTTGQHALPALAAAGHRFLSLAVGDSHTCGLASDSLVRCWGRGFGLTPVALPFQ